MNENSIGKYRNTICNKQKMQQNLRTLSDNNLTKLPGNAGLAKILSFPVSSWVLLFDNNILSNIISCINIYIEKISDNFQRD